MYGFASGFRLEEETVIRWLALGMVVALLSMAVIPAINFGNFWGALSLLPDNKAASAAIMLTGVFHQALWAAALAMTPVGVGTVLAVTVGLGL